MNANQDYDVYKNLSAKMEIKRKDAPDKRGNASDTREVNVTLFCTANHDIETLKSFANQLVQSGIEIVLKSDTRSIEEYMKPPGHKGDGSSSDGDEYSVEKE